MSDDAQLDELMAAAWRRNGARIVERVGHVRAAVAREDEQPSAELRSDLHALVGTLGTYGWARGSDLVAEVQACVVDGGSARHFLAELDQLERDLRAALESP